MLFWRAGVPADWRSVKLALLQASNSFFKNDSLAKMLLHADCGTHISLTKKILQANSTDHFQ